MIAIEDSIQLYFTTELFICGQKIQFAWKVESGGIITYDTVTKFFNPLSIYWPMIWKEVLATNWTLQQ